jgi:hypothetical protein
MPETCVRCGKRRGSRACRPLGGALCARCCGTERLVKVTCPADCSHLGAHEAFQRTRQKERYREAWSKTNQDLRGRQDRLELLLELESSVKRAADGAFGSSDADVVEAIADVSCRLSPIEIGTRAPTPLGRLLWDELRYHIEEGCLLREDVREGLARLGRLVDALREPEAPRAFLQGLSARLEGLPAREREPERMGGLIVTPSDLRRGA